MIGWKSDIPFRVLFYVVFLLLGCIQIYYTELSNDESYYWVYSLNLDWGFFDHPPMIALLIKCGYVLFQNEFGVRLIPMLLGVATIFLLEKLIHPTNLKLFYTIITSIAIFHIANILALPDTPLLFFSLLFFLLFKKYLETDRLSTAILLGIVMALMLYSKYHAVLIIGFAVLANLSLIKRKSFWLSALMLLVLMMPHVYWQYQNDFPSIKYHLAERNPVHYVFNNTLFYIVTQPFILGPFIGILIFYSLFVFKPQTAFEHTLKICAYGIYIFFFVLTLNGPIEGHWTLLTIIPSVYIVYTQAEIDDRIKHAIYWLLPLSLISIMVLRVFLIWDFLPAQLAIDTGFHHNREKAKEIEILAKNDPVAFMNSYQWASKYQFYSGHKSFSLTNFHSRKNQYTVWDSEGEFQGKNVVLILNYKEGNYPVSISKIDSLEYLNIKNFRSFNNVEITPQLDQVVCKSNQQVFVPVTMKYTNGNTRDFESDTTYIPYFSYVIFDENEPIAEQKTITRICNNMLGSNKPFDVEITAPSKPGKYRLYFCVKAGWLPSYKNGGKVLLEVTK